MRTHSGARRVFMVSCSSSASRSPTVARYMCRHSRPPSQGWRTFLSNHVDGIAAIDLFVLPTIAFQILYCLVIVPPRTTTLGVWQQQPNGGVDLAPGHRGAPVGHLQYRRDRDTSYGPVFLRRIRTMGIRDHQSPRSPWQNAYVERLISSIRRECLDHIVVFSGAPAPNSYADMAPITVGRGPIDLLNKDASPSRGERLQRVSQPVASCASPSILRNLIFGTHRRPRGSGIGSSKGCIHPLTIISPAKSGRSRLIEFGAFCQYLRKALNHCAVQF